MYIDKNCWNISLKFEFAAVMNCNSLVFLTPYLSFYCKSCFPPLPIAYLPCRLF